MKGLRLLLATLLAIVGANNASAQEAYAVYTSDNTTLTFFYDNLRSSRSGTKYDLYTDFTEPAWYDDGDGIYGDVTNVVFDPSFADARPTMAYGWFLEMENLTTITGLEYLNTSEVTNMADMFNTCISLTSLDLSHFDTGNVTIMSGMFAYCYNLTSLDLSNFDTGNVTRMGYMFNKCKKLTTLDLTSFNTANVTEMFNMFYECFDLTTIYVGGGWSTEKVINSDNSEDMFVGCTNLKGGAGTAYQDENPDDKTYARIDDPDNGKPGYFTAGPPEPYAVLNGSTLTFYYDNMKATRVGTKYSLPYGSEYYSYPGWTDSTNGNADITSVDFDESFDGYRLTATVNLFNGLSSLTTISHIDRLHTDEVTTMQGMFKGCSSLTSIDVSNFITANVTTMQEMFSDCSSLTSLNLSNFNTEKVTSLYRMFWHCSGLTAVNVSSFRTSKVTSMTQMFTNCSKLEVLDLRNFEVGYINANYMFQTCSKLQTIYCNDSWNLSSSTNMFAGCSSLSSPAIPQFNNTMIDGRYANPTTGYFTQKVDIPGAEAYAVLDGSTLTFYYDDQKDSRTGTPYVINRTSATQGWYGNTSITTVDFDESFASYDGLTSLIYFFAELTNLTEIRNLTRMNTKNVTNMSVMFLKCSSLTELDLSGFNTKKVTSMQSMFADCSSLQKIIVSNNWSTEKLSSSTQSMFYNCTSLAGSSGTTFDGSHITATYAHIDGGTSNPGYLSGVPHPYGIYTESNATLVFYYDDQANKRSDTSPLSFPLDGSAPRWKDNTFIKHVYFDSSFANFHPTNLHALFYGCTGITDFNNLQFLNTENVTDMSMMFYCCKMESIDLSHFNTGKVEDMSDMFGNCSGLTTLDVNSFNTQNVTNMSGMFSGCSNLTTIYCDNDWNSSIITNSNNMFYNCTKLKSGSSNKSYVEADITAQFANPTNGYFTHQLDQPYAVLNGNTLTFYYDNQKYSRIGEKFFIPWDNAPEWKNNTTFTKVIFDSSFANYRPTSLRNMFNGCTGLKTIEGIQYLNTEEVTDMSYMFAYSTLTSLDLSSFNTAKVVHMDHMFAYCYFLEDLDISSFDTQSVTNMEAMFYGCHYLTYLDVSHFNTAKVTNMSYMFGSCASLRYIYCTNNWKTTTVTTSERMFQDCNRLNGAITYNSNKVTVDYANPTNGYFRDKSPYAQLSTDNETLIFYYGRMNKNEGKVDLLDSFNGWAGTYPMNARVKTVEFDASFDSCYELTRAWYLFSGLPVLTTINNLERLHTENVTDMTEMFQGCKALETVDLSSLNTQHVTNMSGMFSDCSSLTSLNLSSFNTQNVTNMEAMFWDCNSLVSLDVSHFKTQNVTNMFGMFQGCESLVSLDVTHFDTQNVTNMGRMFYDCKSLVSLDVTHFDTKNVTNMGGMFSVCESLTQLDITNFDTQNVTGMAIMFSYCKSLTSIDLTNFDTKNAHDISAMFRGCTNLELIFCNDDWMKDEYLSASSSFLWENMFLGCTSLRSNSSGKSYNANDVSPQFANPSTGYFTIKIAGGAEAYALYNESSSTLTFYCDTQRSSREGTGRIYNLNTGNNDPEWYMQQLVAEVVFDPSFANARPTSTYSWFSGMCSLSSITGIEYLNTSCVAYMGNMFNGCMSLTSIDVSHFNTAKVTEMGYMFYQCSDLTSLNLSGWNTANVKYMDSMFQMCSALATIYVDSSWSTDAVSSSNYMFDLCYKLKGGNGTTFDSDHVTAEYARIDDPANGKPGYFTEKPAFIPGDANGDSNVSIADVTAVISYILTNGHPTGTFNVNAANVDGVEGITIGDVRAIVNLILNK